MIGKLLLRRWQRAVSGSPVRGARCRRRSRDVDHNVQLGDFWPDSAFPAGDIILVSGLGELSALIAHELNQPLGAILNNTEVVELILNSSSPNLDEIKDAVSDIRRDNQRASEVIRRVRSLLKKSVFEPQQDLNESLREVFEFVSVQAVGRNVALSSALSSQPHVSAATEFSFSRSFSI